MKNPIKDITAAINEDVAEHSSIENGTKEFKSSFDYRAVPLDEQMTLDENGVPFTLKELIEINELRDDEK